MFEWAPAISVYNNLAKQKEIINCREINTAKYFSMTVVNIFAVCLFVKVNNNNKNM